MKKSLRVCSCIALFFFAGTLFPPPVSSQSSGDVRRANILGLVLDPQGRPIEGAAVSARDEQDRLVARAETNQEGIYLMECLDPDQYQLSFDPASTGLQQQTAGADLTSAGLVVNWAASATASTVSLMRPGTCCRGSASPGSASLRQANIVGIVLDGHGSPVEGVEIAARDRNNQLVARALTANRGAYSLECLEPGQYQLSLAPLETGFRGQTVAVSLGSDGIFADWSVSSEAPAVAVARRGMCCDVPASSVAEVLAPLIGLGGLAATSGIGAAAAAGVFSGEENTPRSPVSPSE